MLNIGFLSHYLFVKTLFPSYLHHNCLQFLYPTNFLVRECFSVLVSSIKKKNHLKSIINMASAPPLQLPSRGSMPVARGGSGGSIEPPLRRSRSAYVEVWYRSRPLSEAIRGLLTRIIIIHYPSVAAEAFKLNRKRLTNPHQGRPVYTISTVEVFNLLYFNYYESGHIYTDRQCRVAPR